MSDEQQELSIDEETVATIRSNLAVRTEEFIELIDKIKEAPPQIRKMWKETYENASDDRANAYVLFSDLYMKVVSTVDGHALYGKQIAIYLERMNRANEQLLKLSELVMEFSAHDEIDAESLYRDIEKESGNKYKQGR